MAPKLLTMSEASQLLRIPVATLRWYRHKGIGPRSALVGGESCTAQPTSSRGWTISLST